jgi:glycerol-3-phosphate acyltransferase PlsY
LRYSSLAALVAAAAAPVDRRSSCGAATLLLVAVAIIAMALIVKHWANLQRLMAGTEPKIGGKKRR